MIINWQRLFGWAFRPAGFVVAVTVAGGVFGLVPVSLTHVFVQPQSRFQFVVSVLGFATFGLIVSIFEVFPPSVKAHLAASFNRQSSLSRTGVLAWVLAFAVAVSIFWVFVRWLA